MKQYQITITQGVGKNKKVTTKISESPYDFYEVNTLMTQLGQGMTTAPHLLKEGESAISSASVNASVSVTCIVNRCQRRAPEVIAAEKALRQQKQTKRAEENARQEKEREKCRLFTRKRITNQIDHAFQTGQSGSEPVAKYITCNHCSGPADFLYLNRTVPPGAAVLDETTIDGAVCTEHNYAAKHAYYKKQVTEIFPCALLEFFYTGIRQIAIKR